MKRFVLVCLTLLLAGTALAEEEGAMGAPPEMKTVAGLSGDWDVAFNYRMDPSQPWMEMKSTTVNTLVLDGCALMAEFRGDMMGMPMKGINLMSYSRNAKKWQNVWIDNMGGSLSYMEGEMKDGAIVMVGDDYMAGQSIKIRITQYNMTADSYDWKMEASLDGTEWVELGNAKYTRKKESSSGSDSKGW